MRQAPSFQVGGRIDLPASWKLGVAIRLAKATEMRTLRAKACLTTLSFPSGMANKVPNGGCSVSLGS